MSKTAIQANQLVKQFANTVAVNHLDLTIPTGAIFGLLGINGAGKTTFIRMVMGHLHPTDGDLSVL
ncbi:MAG: ATP-binding cassette domain-containing protein, partial [Planctomycetes bacterium]|nr:ATP-binding cassette domain-containing protein [Planctomycetota bacterium]